MESLFPTAELLKSSQTARNKHITIFFRVCIIVILKGSPSCWTNKFIVKQHTVSEALRDYMETISSDEDFQQNCLKIVNILKLSWMDLYYSAFHRCQLKKTFHLPETLDHPLKLFFSCKKIALTFLQMKEISQITSMSCISNASIYQNFAKDKKVNNIFR